MGTHDADTMTVEHDGLSFDVRGWGPDDGEPVLLLHGFPQTSRSWSGVAAALDEHGLRLLAPDQRGYSPRARPDEVEAYAIDRLAADAVAIAEALGHPTFHLVGHDWGAAVAWWLAAHEPERVRSLTALSVPHLAAFGRALADDPDQQERSSYIRTFRRPGEAEEGLLADDAEVLRGLYAGRVAADDVEHYVEVMRGGALTPALSWYRAMGDLSQTPAVRVPTTFVWGDDDWASGRTGALACGDHVDADYRFVELLGVSHWSLDEAPDRVADEVARRVTGRRPPGTEGS